MDTEHNLVHLHPLVNGKYSERNTYGPSDVLHSVIFTDLKIDLNGVFTEIE
ncbi:hypothetical protein [Salicibibacter cibarius]|uniref:hypothetical protein n=1 Tax=Salicibibacter cibarius TaxID=2743000 RepID=UPI001FEAF57D|nr:hypothetical protein [Salicibibacter cibarius]